MDAVNLFINVNVDTVLNIYVIVIIIVVMKESAAA
ncbi:hypothetical protein SDC9_205691 [bioreactor metagenome]|uniref:Uncharacterized protein n=1 Tax=bioreactor metagenome TaxID=1076179 RepID=A0A645J2R1_9ZZZZ